MKFDIAHFNHEHCWNFSSKCPLLLHFFLWLSLPLTAIRAADVSVITTPFSKANVVLHPKAINHWRVCFCMDKHTHSGNAVPSNKVTCKEKPERDKKKWETGNNQGRNETRKNNYWTITVAVTSSQAYLNNTVQLQRISQCVCPETMRESHRRPSDMRIISLTAPRAHSWWFICHHPTYVCTTECKCATL